MIIAVALTGMVQVPVHQIVGVVAVGHRFVPAVRPVHMPFFMTAALVSRRAERRIVAADRDAMLLDPALARVVQMSVVQIIGVTLVLHRRMPAVGTVCVRVAIVNVLTCHD